MTLVGACMGKYVTGLNGNHKIYPNLWTNILTASGKGKTEIKNPQRLAEQALNEVAETTFEFLQDTFTFAYLFSELGGGFIPTKDLNKMDDYEKRLKKLEIEERSRKRKAASSSPTKLTFTFEKIIQSGTQTGELGKAIKLADCSGEIDGSTATDGFRTIKDLCISLFGMTQVSNWHNKFCTGVLSEQGLPQRFTTVNPLHYTLTLERLDLCQEAVEAQIKDLTKRIIEKVVAMGKRVCTIWDPQAPSDFVAEGWQRLMGSSFIKPFLQYDIVDLEAVDGKLKTAAVKMMLIHQFLVTEIKPQEASLAPWESSLKEETPTKMDLTDRTVYEMYLGLLMVNYCRHSTTLIVDPEVSRTNRKLVTNLMKAKDHAMSNAICS